jgi:protein ImuB
MIAAQISQAPERRVLCLVLPDLPCELVMPRLKLSQISLRADKPYSGRATKTDLKRKTSRPLAALPLAVVVTEQARALEPADTLDAVNESARRGGIRVGQSIAEANAQMGKLQVRALSSHEVQRALEQVAEAVLQFGISAALHAPDTLCLDITGVAHLFGGEQALANQVAARVRSMGHSVRVAVANGPLVAQALARWANYSQKDQGVRCFHPKTLVNELAVLPVAALPIAAGSANAVDTTAASDDLVAWLVRCGLYSIGDLQRLPVASLAARLGSHGLSNDSARVVTDFMQGQDVTPLVPYQLAPQLCEEFEAEEGMRGVEPLLFVLRGLCARLSARLQGRAQAVRELKLTLLLDKSIAALHATPATVSCEIALPAAIFKAEELERIVSTRSKRLGLDAPIVTVRLQASDVTEAPALQLDLSRVLPGSGGSRARGAEVMPLLVAEIAADIGRARVGVLREVASHIPEGKSALVEPVLSTRDSASKVAPVTRGPGAHSRGAHGRATLQATEQRSFAQLLNEKKLLQERNLQVVEQEPARPKLQPTRLLPRPVPLNVKLEQGVSVVIGGTLFTIEKAEFERRLSEIEWWSATAISRDYWSLWLHSPTGSCAALAFVERKTGKRFLQALYD